MADSDVDRLYGLPPEDFVAARDALAKQLRAARDREGAAAVKGLANPSRAAGVVNRVLREHPDEAAALREAALALERAQADLLAGGGADALRETAETARAAVEALVAHVPDGESAATREAVRSTLTAATVDPEAREEVLAARLTRELVAAGFGGLAMVSTAPARARQEAAAQERRRDADLATGDGRGARRGGVREEGRATRGATRDVVEDDATGRRTRARGRKGDPAARRARADREAEERRAREAAEREERDARRRRDALRRAKEAEAVAERGVDAARAAVEQVEATLASRRADLRDAKSRLAEARRRRARAERPT